MTGVIRHPAPFSGSIIDAIRELADRYVCGGALILDPFAGIGRIHEINEGREGDRRYDIWCVELEQEWAAQCALLGPTWCGDFLTFDFGGVGKLGLFDAVVTSPTYGNRMADHHEARDGSPRRSYRHLLGRRLTEGNSGEMQWGDEYRAFHWLAWKRVHKVLRDDGVFILNVSNHIRKFEEQEVVGWHQEIVERVGFKMIESRKVTTPRMRMGQNHQARVDGEWVLVFQKVSTGVTESVG